MPGCQACQHPRLAAINQALQAGESVTTLAHAYGLSRSSMRNHLERGHAGADPAAAVVGHVSTIVDTLPATESQARPGTMTALRQRLDALDAELAMLHKASQHLAAHQLYTREWLVRDLARFGPLDWLPPTDHRPTLKEAVDARLAALHPTYPAVQAAAAEATIRTKAAMEAHWQTVAAQLTPEALAAVPCLTPLPVDERVPWVAYCCGLEATCGPWRSLGVLAMPRIVTQRLAPYQLRALRRVTSQWLRATYPFAEEALDA